MQKNNRQIRGMALALLAIVAAVPTEAQTPAIAGDRDNAWGVSSKRYGLAEYINVDAYPDLPTKSETETIRAVQIGGSAPANILWPGEKAEVTLQIVNKTDTPLRATGKLRVVPFALRTDPTDMFRVGIRKVGAAGSVPLTVNIGPKGYQDVVIKPTIPETFGGYALILELDGQEPLFVATLARSLKNPPLGKEYRLCMDIMNVPALQRMGAAPNRIGMAFRSPGDPDYAEYYEKWAAKMREFKAAGLPVTVEFGHETPMTGPIQPLGVPRNLLQNEGGKLVNRGVYNGDIAWMPQYDPAFKAWVKRVALEFGWPKGPVNAMKIWNEAWEGGSIAGWGADMIRFRELQDVMVEAVQEARKEGGVEVLTGGTDSSSNTEDKLFPDGDNRFLESLDFLSIHYQGMAPASTTKKWVDRKNPRGRVRIWDTESWIANSDDRIAAVLPTMYASGHDRAVGIHSQRICSSEAEIEVRTPKGTTRRVITQAWPVAAAVGALQHFVGNKKFEKILYHGLPWVYLFRDAKDRNDGTIVVVGDVAPVFGAGNVLFRNIRGLSEVAAKKSFATQVAAAVSGKTYVSESAAADALWKPRGPLVGVTLSLPDGGGRFRLHDSSGNRIPARSGKIVVPVDDRGFYLRTDGRPGSFDALLKAMATARVEGLQPVDFVVHDPVAPVAARPMVRVELVNILNRPIEGALSLRVGALTLGDYSRRVRLAPFQRLIVPVAVTGGKSDPANEYLLSAAFDAGKDGLALHHERIRCNVIARRTVSIDGDLKDWEGVLPQTIRGDSAVSRTDAEIAWKPYEPFSATAKKGLATAYLAYDENYLYFAAKIADDTDDGGTLRFETRDDDSFFYPEVTFLKDEKTGNLTETRWPAGVRRYSYAKPFIIPAGNEPLFDNVQIALNALPETEKPWYPFPPGTMRGFTGYWTTDYEYALNAVSAAHGGGTEIWRLRHPLMPDKHFFPRQPKSSMDGPVRAGKLIIRRVGNTRIVECALPWSEIPAAKARRDAGQTIKFSFRVNDNADVGCLELARNRSVSRISFPAFKADWKEHWANEVEFGFEKTENGKDLR